MEKFLQTLADNIPTSGDSVWRWYRVLHDDPCPYCGTRMTISTQAETHPHDGTRDHITPRSQGGLTELNNITMACASCNGDKGARTLLEFIHDGALKRSFEQSVSRDSQLESRTLAARVLRYATETYGDLVTRPTRGGKRVRQMIAWVSLEAGADSRDVALMWGMADNGKSISDMAEAWEKKMPTPWGINLMAPILERLES